MESVGTSFLGHDPLRRPQERGYISHDDDDGPTQKKVQRKQVCLPRTGGGGGCVRDQRTPEKCL